MCRSKRRVSVEPWVSIAADRYPNADVQVSLPIDAGVFFVEEPVSRTAWLRREWPERVAA